MPASMVRLCDALVLNVRKRDYIRNIYSRSSSVPNPQHQIVVLGGTEAVSCSTHLRSEQSVFAEHFLAKSLVEQAYRPRCTRTKRLIAIILEGQWGPVILCQPSRRFLAISGQYSSSDEGGIRISIKCSLDASHVVVRNAHVVVRESNDFAPSEADACIQTVRQPLTRLEGCAEVAGAAVLKGFQHSLCIIARIVIYDDQFEGRVGPTLVHQGVQCPAEK